MGCTLSTRRPIVIVCRPKTLSFNKMDLMMSIAVAIVIVVAYVGIRKPPNPPTVEMSPLIKVVQPDLGPKFKTDWMDLDDGYTSDSDSNSTGTTCITSPVPL